MQSTELLTFDQYIDLIKAVLKQHQDMFECDVTYHPSIDLGRYVQDPDGDSYREVSWPYGATRDDTIGLLLKGRVGIITIQVRLKKNGRYVEEVGHSYRYIDSKHKISMEYQNEDTTIPWGPKEYSFRYDKDFTARAESDPPIHLQMAHSAPRFIMKDITIIDFINTVRGLCFTEQLEPNSLPFFSNRR